MFLFYTILQVFLFSRNDDLGSRWTAPGTCQWTKRLVKSSNDSTFTWWGQRKCHYCNLEDFNHKNNTIFTRWYRGYMTIDVPRRQDFTKPQKGNVLFWRDYLRFSDWLFPRRFPCENCTTKQYLIIRRQTTWFNTHIIHVWHVRIHVVGSWLVFMLNVGKYTIHGLFGRSWWMSSQNSLQEWEHNTLINTILSYGTLQSYNILPTQNKVQKQGSLYDINPTIIFGKSLKVTFATFASSLIPAKWVPSGFHVHGTLKWTSWRCIPY